MSVVAASALGCYMVSQRVASERTAVERLDRQILMARLDIRKLETELGTRSRMPVLEQWNSQVLALSAPSASQYLHGEIQLARFEPGRDTAPAMPAGSDVIRPSEARPARIIPVSATPTPTPTPTPAPVAEPQPMLRHASYIRPADGEFGGVQPASLLDDGILAELQSAAQREKRGSNGDR